MKNGFYRPDIDGLRGIAILLVVAYHAFPNALTAGFIGVDVFFVISGFLITQLLLQRQPANIYLTQFYRRRLLRLGPALLVLLLSCLLVGWRILLPSEFRELNKHTGAAALFANNLLLYREVNYFDSAVQKKPLMHLWSLGVEEQFYLLWPLALLFARKVRAHWQITIILTCLSLGLYFYALTLDAAAAFYLPFTRLWQLLTGALLALYFSKPKHTFCQYNLASLAALLLLLTASFTMDSNTHHPSLLTIVPTVCAAIFIINANSKINLSFIAVKPLILIGKLSYSLYLWHWPVLALLFIVIGLDASTELRLLALFVGIICSLFSYYFVEKPLRHTKKPLARYIAIGLILTCAFSLSNYHWGGVNANRTALADTNTPEGRFYIKAHRDPLFLSQQFEQREIMVNNTDCSYWHDAKLSLMALLPQDQCLQKTDNRNNVIILGDSFADDTFGAMRQHFPDAKLIRIPLARCEIIPYFYRDPKSDCRHYLQASGIRTILIAKQWTGHHAEFQDDLGQLIMDGFEVIVIGPGIEFDDWLFNLLAHREPDSSLQDSVYSRMKTDRFALNESMQQFYQQHNITYINRIALFCTTLTQCELLNDNGTPFMIDWGHLFPAGLEFFGKKLALHPLLQHLHKTSIQ